MTARTRARPPLPGRRPSRCPLAALSLVAAASLAAAILAVGAPAAAQTPRDALLARLAAVAKQADPDFTGFSAERGAALFRTRHGGGKPATPACTACHDGDPAKPGKTRAGKIIEPLAVSRTPDRFTDAKKVAKWFRRNCKSVLGRECTAREKGDFITFMVGQ